MCRKSLDLALVVGIAIAATATILLGLSPVLRLALGILLVLVLPGYALVAALFPGRSLATPERLLFIIGLSLTATALGGLVPNFIPWEFEQNPWDWLLTTIPKVASRAEPARRTFQ